MLAKLIRMNKHGIACPQPITRKNNMLVMTFIGRDQVPAPRLKDANLPEEEMKEAYEQTVKVGLSFIFIIIFLSFFRFI